MIGINRWAIRVLAYISLMRDEYPPFRLDVSRVNPNPRPHPNLELLRAGDVVSGGGILTRLQCEGSLTCRGRS